MANTYLQRVSISVINIDKSEDFYTKVLEFNKIYHKTIPLNRISGYPTEKVNANGILELAMLSQEANQTMIGLMKISPVDEKKKAALVFYTKNIENVKKNFERYGGKITMGIRDGESFDFKTCKVRESYVLMGTDPDEHFIEIIEFKK